MEVERMNTSVDNMEKIVQKMTTIKDSYELLEKNTLEIENVIEKILALKNDLTHILDENRHICEENKKTTIELSRKGEIIQENMKIKLENFIEDVAHLLKKEKEEFNKDFGDKFEKELMNLKNEVQGLIDVNKKDNFYYRTELFKTQKLIKILLILNSIFLAFLIILECCFKIF